MRPLTHSGMSTESVQVLLADVRNVLKDRKYRAKIEV